MLGIFLDLETNGLNPYKHRTLEIALKIVDLDTGAIQASYDSIVYQPPHIWEKSDLSSLAINGFTQQKIHLGKSEKIIADDIVQLFEKMEIKRGSSVFICQNPSFDRSFFSQLIDVEIQEKNKWPYHWLDFASMFWALHVKDIIDHPFVGLSKNDIAKTFNIPPEETPHRAMNGVNHLLLCYQTVIGHPVHQSL